MRAVISIFFILTQCCLTLAAGQAYQLTSEQIKSRDQLILQILKNESGEKLKMALKEILPTSDHSFIEKNIPERLNIQFKFDQQTVVLGTKQKIILGQDHSMMMNGVRVKYDWSESFENNMSSMAEKSNKFSLFQLLLPSKAQAGVGLVAGIAVDYLVPAVIMAVTGSNAAAYGAMSWSFFNQSYIGNAHIICSRNGKLHYDQSANDFGKDLPEDQFIKAALKEYQNKSGLSGACTEKTAIEAEKQVRVLALAAATKARQEDEKKRSAGAAVKGVSAPIQRQGTAY